MYFIQLRKLKLVHLLFVLIAILIFTNIFVKAEVDTLLPEEKNLQVSGTQSRSNSEAFDYEDFRTSDDFDSSPESRRAKVKNNPLVVSDSAFSSNGGLTFKNFLIRTSLIVFALIGFFVLLKIYLSRRAFSQGGNFLDELAQKFGGNFSPDMMRLKQTLILTPGQNLYVIEVEGKKLLVGGTHQGGVHFLADLTEKKVSGTLDFKQIEEYQNQAKNFMPEELVTNRNSNYTPKPNGNNLPKETETQTLTQDRSISKTPQLKQPFKRRTSFRQSLLNEVPTNGTENIIYTS